MVLVRRPSTAPDPVSRRQGRRDLHRDRHRVLPRVHRRVTPSPSRRRRRRLYRAVSRRPRRRRTAAERSAVWSRTSPARRRTTERPARRPSQAFSHTHSLTHHAFILTAPGDALSGAARPAAAPATMSRREARAIYFPSRLMRRCAVRPSIAVIWPALCPSLRRRRRVRLRAVLVGCEGIVSFYFLTLRALLFGAGRRVVRLRVLYNIFEK